MKRIPRYKAVDAAAGAIDHCRPKSIGWRLPWKQMERLIQTTHAYSEVVFTPTLSTERTIDAKFYVNEVVYF